MNIIDSIVAGDLVVFRCGSSEIVSSFGNLTEGGKILYFNNWNSLVYNRKFKGNFENADPHFLDIVAVYKSVEGIKRVHQELNDLKRVLNTIIPEA